MKASLIFATLSGFLSIHTFYDPWSPFQSENGKLILQQKTDYPGQSQEELYQKAIAWFSNPLESQLISRSKEKGCISGGCHLSLAIAPGGNSPGTALLIRQTYE